MTIKPHHTLKRQIKFQIKLIYFPHHHLLFEKNVKLDGYDVLMIDMNDWKYKTRITTSKEKKERESKTKMTDDE